MKRKPNKKGLKDIKISTILKLGILFYYIVLVIIMNLFTLPLPWESNKWLYVLLFTLPYLLIFFTIACIYFLFWCIWKFNKFGVGKWKQNK